MKYRLSFLVLVLFASAACSNQWREADADITASEMLSMLNEVSAASAGGDVANAKALSNDPNAAIYFADAPASGWTVASVASLIDWTFLGSSGNGLWYGGIAEVRVFYIDVPSSPRQTGLIIGIKKNGESAYTYHGFTGTGSMGSEDYETVLSQNGQKRLVLRSMDVEDDDLAPVIQLKAFAFDSLGEYYIGKFSTLVGFGP
jgi:hypothetical protein